LIAVSGLGPKEPAAFLVEAEGRRLLLDCGEGPEPGRLPDFDKIGRVDAVVLSHSHPDHSGGLRFRDRIGNPPVYATRPVLKWLKDTRLKDTPVHDLPIRGQTEILGLKATTGADGHAPGGIWLRLAVGDGLLYMGDHSSESRLYNFDTPPATPTMIIDGSYGDATETLEPQRRALAELVAGGPALLPIPADGRGADIAIFLQERGFDVAIDDAVRFVATMLTREASASLNGTAAAGLRRLLETARHLDEASEPHGAMVAHGGSADAGVSSELIKRWRDQREVEIIFTGHLAVGTTGRKLVDMGRARFRRWNVHPRFADNLDLVEAVDPKRVVPAFGDSKYLRAWRGRIVPRELVSSKIVML
jgi:Cft2 family RNA processing exonuclease